MHDQNFAVIDVDNTRIDAATRTDSLWAEALKARDRAMAAVDKWLDSLCGPFDV